MQARAPGEDNSEDISARSGSRTEAPNIPLVTQATSIRTTMEVIDHFAKGIAMVVDEHAHLLATVTDGDIRRAILAGIDLGHPVTRLQKSEKSNPVVADMGTPDLELLALMDLHSVRQIPLLRSEPSCLRFGGPPRAS